MKNGVDFPSHSCKILAESFQITEGDDQINMFDPLKIKQLEDEISKI